MADKREFNQQVKLLALGALLGFIPSFLLSGIQYRQQREQFLFEKRITAIKDFSAALNSGDVLEKLDQLDLAVYGLSLRPNSQKAIDSASKAIEESQSSWTHYQENVRTAGITMNAVFGLRIPVPNFQYSPHPLDPKEPTLSRKEFVQACDRVLQEDEKLRAAIAAYATTGQEMLEKAASDLQR